MEISGKFGRDQFRDLRPERLRHGHQFRRCGGNPGNAGFAARSNPHVKTRLPCQNNATGDVPHGRQFLQMAIEDTARCKNQ